MLGELIYEGKGKMIGMRVLDDNGTMETTYQEGGTIFGIACTITLTVASTPTRRNWILGRVRDDAD